MRLFAVAAPGLEEVVAAELRRLCGAAVGDGGVTVVPGGVEWSGGLEDVYRANLWSRVATRIYLRVAEVKAHDFAALRRGVGALPWEQWITAGIDVHVTAAARKCRLYHTGAIAERVTGGIQDRLAGSGSASGSIVEVLARGEHDVFTLSIDTSGELLHKRGYRGEQREAPLRETLAAGMLALAGWDPTTPLLDPMCGSGTIPIEAALLAAGRAPGAERRFTFEGWPSHDAALWDRLRAEAARSARTSGEAAPMLFASDRDGAAIEIARRNAERAGVADRITFTQAAVRDLSENRTPSGMNVHSAAAGAGAAGLVITNPPYGKRIAAARGRGGVTGDLRALWRSLPGWRLAVVTPDRNLPAALGARPRAAHALVNGGLRVTLFVFDPRGGTIAP